MCHLPLKKVSDFPPHFYLLDQRSVEYGSIYIIRFIQILFSLKKIRGNESFFSLKKNKNKKLGPNKGGGGRETKL